MIAPDQRLQVSLNVTEEARALIPKSSGLQDVDVSGALARRAMRELAYEGRKFSLGFGLISQKPSTIDQEVVSQSNTFILHQLYLCTFRLSSTRGRLASTSGGVRASHSTKCSDTPMAA